MRLKTLFLGITLLLTVNSFCQLMIADYKLREKNARCFISGNSDGHVITSIIYKDGSDKILTSPDASSRVLKQSCFNTENNISKTTLALYGLSYQCGILSSSGAADCLYDTYNHSIFFTETDFSTGATNISDTLVLQNNQHLLTSFTDSNLLYNIVSNQGSDIITVYYKQFKQKPAYYQLSIPVSDAAPGAPAAAVARLADFYQKGIPTSFYTSDCNYPLQNAASITPYKIYHQPGKLIFSLENNTLETFIITIDLAKHSYTADAYPLIKGNFQFTDARFNYTNSYLSGDLLFKTGWCESVFFCYAINTRTHQVLYRELFNDARQTQRDLYQLQPFATGIFYKEEKVTKERKLYSSITTYPTYINILPMGGDLYKIEMNWYSRKVSILDVFSLPDMTNNYGAGYPFSVLGGLDAINNYNTFRTLNGNLSSYKVQSLFNASTGRFIDQNSAEAVTNENSGAIIKAGLFRKNYPGRMDNLSIYSTGNYVYLMFTDNEAGRLFIYRL